MLIAQAAAIPPAIITSAARIPSGIATLCQMGWCGLRRRLRTRVAIRLRIVGGEGTRPLRLRARRNPACRPDRLAARRLLQVLVDWGEGGKVKLVIGIVRPEQANQVLEALYRAEVRGFSMSRVQGHGGEMDRVETYRGTTVQMGLSEKMRFEVAVSDDFVDKTVEALCEGGRTGEVGDGKIFVVPLDHAVRIRTGDSDEGAVTPVGK